MDATNADCRFLVIDASLDVFLRDWLNDDFVAAIDTIQQQLQRDPYGDFFLIDEAMKSRIAIAPLSPPIVVIIHYAMHLQP